MAIPVQPTLSITTDDAVFVVEQLPPPLRDLVIIMDEYRQQERDASVAVNMAQGAIRDIQAQLLRGIQEHATQQPAAQQESVPTDPPKAKTKAKAKAKGDTHE